MCQYRLVQYRRFGDTSILRINSGLDKTPDGIPISHPTVNLILILAALSLQLQRKFFKSFQVPANTNFFCDEFLN